MRTDPLTTLLQELNQGEPLAIERTFAASLPYLRGVIRRRLPGKMRAKFDSVDVVQSVWASLLQGLAQGRWHFDTAGQLRAFLVQVAHRRLSDRLRRHQSALDHEEPLPEAQAESLPAQNQPRPSEVVQAEDVWERMLELCSPEHHAILRLRRQGLPLAEIAARTGFHEGSIRRILRKLASQLAFADPSAEPAS